MAIIIPEIFAAAINEKLGVSLRLGRTAFDATDMVGEIRTAGDTVHFPQLKRVANAVNVVKGTALIPGTVDMKDTEAKLAQVASPVRVYDIEASTIKGAVMDKMIQQVVDAMAKNIDLSLSTSLDKDAIYKSPVAAPAAITSAEIQTALANFGDDVDTASFAGIAIHSKLLTSFYAMPEFVSTGFTYQTSGNGIVENGVVGYYMGIPVIVTNNGTFDTVKNECKTYIIKKDSLGYIFKKEVGVEEQRDALLLCTDIVASSIYATKLLDEKGVVICRKTVV